MKKIISTIIGIAIVLGVIWLGHLLYRKYLTPVPETVFKTEKIGRSDLRSTISASGTVEPEELINVGAQVNGKIMKFGTDADGKVVDYTSRITAGSVLAQIDDVLYEAEVRQAKASRQQAVAAITSAKANIDSAKANLVLATLNWQRAQELYPKKAMSKSDYDAAKASYLSGEAGIGVAEASLAQAQSQLASSEAALLKAERNLGFCVITSPVDGVIIDRRVSIGQTVVSNMSASSIFLIAKDLKKMQVWASVNEADIGEIKVGMPVIFTVDAFPNLRFRGQVHKVRLNATMSQNVVTYVVEISTDNSDGKLLPYLTANVRFIKASRENVLTVSNAALRYQPEMKDIAPAFRKENTGSMRGADRILWKVGKDNLLYPVKVRIGLMSSGNAEIVSGDIKEGDNVVNGILDTHVPVIKKNSSAGGSPFMPKPPQRKPRNLNPGRTGNRTPAR